MEMVSIAKLTNAVFVNGEINKSFDINVAPEAS